LTTENAKLNLTGLLGLIKLLKLKNPFGMLNCYHIVER